MRRRLIRNAQNRGEAPSPAALRAHSRCFASAFLVLRTASKGRLCSPRARGEVSTSASVPTPRFLFRGAGCKTEVPFSANSGLCLFPSSTAGEEKKKQRKDAERRPAQHNVRNCRCGARRARARSPVGALPRLWPGRQLVPKALHQAMLRETV